MDIMRRLMLVLIVQKYLDKKQRHEGYCISTTPTLTSEKAIVVSILKKMTGVLPHFSPRYPRGRLPKNCPSIKAPAINWSREGGGGGEEWAIIWVALKVVVRKEY